MPPSMTLFYDRTDNFAISQFLLYKNGKILLTKVVTLKFFFTKNFFSGLLGASKCLPEAPDLPRLPLAFSPGSKLTRRKKPLF